MKNIIFEKTLVFSAVQRCWFLASKFNTVVAPWLTERVVLKILTYSLGIYFHVRKKNMLLLLDRLFGFRRSLLLF